MVKKIKIAYEKNVATIENQENTKHNKNKMATLTEKQVIFPITFPLYFHFQSYTPNQALKLYVISSTPRMDDEHN